MNLKQLSGDLMLTIDQVSQLTGVRKSTLRYWEKKFIPWFMPSRTQSNRRKYSLEDLERVKTILHLLEQEHLTGEGVRLRLVELFPTKPEGELSRQANPRAVSRLSSP